MLKRLSRSSIAAPLLVAGVAFGTRAFWTLYASFDPLAAGRFDDSVFYHEAARYIARGQGLVSPWTGLPTALWPPGYPVVLGALYRILPDDPLVAGFANAAAAAGAALAVSALGAAAGGRTAALVAGLAFALLPGQVVFASLTMSETVSAATIAFLTLGALRLRPDGRSTGAALLLGAGVGLAAYVRGQALVLPAVFALFWWLTGTRWKLALLWGTLAAAGALATLAPWAARNLRELGSPMLVSSNVGGNLWQGHHEGATGGMTPDPYPRSFDHLPPQRQEAARSNAMLRDAVRFAVTHPSDEARLAAAKVRLLWSSDTVGIDWNEGYGITPVFSDENGDLVRHVTDASYFATLAFGLAGLALGLARRRPVAVLLSLLLAAWTAVHVVFFGDPRFHFPVMFALCVGAGLLATAATETRRRFAGRRLRPALASSP